MDEPDKGVVAQQIDQWLRKQLVLSNTDHGPCARIMLKHLSIDKKVQGDVASFNVKLDAGSEEIQPIINDICDAAQKDANDLNSGVQIYALYAYFPQDLNYLPRKIFRVPGVNEDIERDLAPSEPPTEKGLVSQAMRHAEMFVKTMTVSQSYMTGSLQKENQRLAEMNEKFAQQQVDFMVLLQDTMDTSHKRRLDEKTAEVTLAMRQSVIEKLESLAPVIINRIAGQTVIPTHDPAFNLMGSLLESLSEKQQLDFLNSLEPNQKPMFAEMLSEYEKRKAAAAGNKPNFIQEALSKKNELPPANAGKQKLLTENADLLDPPDSKPQLGMFKTIADRLKEAPTIISDDPVAGSIESRAKAFASRFRPELQSTKKPDNTEDK